VEGWKAGRSGKVGLVTQQFLLDDGGEYLPEKSCRMINFLLE